MDQLKSSNKETVEQTDEFIELSARLMNYVAEHKSKVVAGALAVCALFILSAAFGKYQDSKALKASAALNAATAKYAAVEDKTDASKLTEVAGDFKMVMKDYSGSISAKFAAIRLADLAYRSGDYDGAIKSYKDISGDLSGDDLLTGLVNSGLAYTYLKKNDTAEAIIYFEKVVAASGKQNKSEALFNLGLLYQTAGDMKKRDEAFSRIVAEHADSVYAVIVKERTTG